MTSSRIATALVVVALAAWGVLLIANELDGNDRPVTRGVIDYGPDGADLEEGLATDGLEEAYTATFEEACADVWSNSPDGNLYYDDVAYAEDSCTSDADTTTLDEAVDDGEIETIDDAETFGREAGYDAAFQESDTLCWGPQCWSRSDF